MIKQTYGFLLLECTLYFFLLISLTTLVGTILIAAQQRAHATAKLSNSTMTQWFGIDRLVHDVNHAPASVDAWKLLDQTHIVWRQKNRDIGWKCQDNKLWRLEGTFDVQECSWARCTRSLVAQDITVQYRPTVDSDGNIKGLYVQMVSGVHGLSQSRIIACEGCT